MTSSSPGAAHALAALPQPYLLFLGDTTEVGFAKTAIGLRDWAPELCVAEWRLPGGTVSTGLPAMTPAQAYAAGARAVVIGVANRGGVLVADWVPALVDALEQGLDLISGLHQRLGDIPELAETASRLGRQLIDVRVPPRGLPVGTGRKRSGKRVLTVGTDCALGKKYTALALARGLRERGVDATFRASGQTGILIAGQGIAMDAVVADFSAGAAELLSPDAADGHWDVIEGQGSLFHPAYAGVSLGLLHGSQPDVFVVCHQPDRAHTLGYPDYPLPSIEEVIDLTVRLGRRTNPAIRCIGVSLNTQGMDAADVDALCADITARLGLPAGDPMRNDGKFNHLVEACLS
ncbi:DUF1611 domain-containing protein [Luteimonas sp. RC10]|uniref:DUF1611 domain-containing protein n=1 Tax=Luteimonas sp. RC10 TaxID=2587035 RepID=UPI001613F25E|nr:DUF1611 domain-containing protein [Luteimonas sp. RC10]MBB3344551.1 putative NAD-dependent epimerase/dehydratase family protein [Luteimonas sp. RC10]